MMNYYNSSMAFPGGAGTMWLSFHWVFGAFAFLGFILLTVWAVKNLSGGKLKSAAIWLLVVGILGSMLTAGPALFGLGNAMSVVSGGQGMMRGSRMMGGNGFGNFGLKAVSQEQKEETVQEGARGKEIWDGMMSKETACGDIDDEGFEMLGDYFMGLMAGDSHAAMDAMMEQMMGGEAEEQMHISMGKRMSACDPDAPMPSMMNGGMMQMMGGGMMGR